LFKDTADPNKVNKMYYVEEANTATEEFVDARPLHLKEFPSETAISKNLRLGVLLGRYRDPKGLVGIVSSRVFGCLHHLSLGPQNVIIPAGGYNGKGVNATVLPVKYEPSAIVTHQYTLYIFVT
jgi:hypothetical protein